MAAVRSLRGIGLFDSGFELERVIPANSVGKILHQIIVGSEVGRPMYLSNINQNYINGNSA